MKKQFAIVIFAFLLFSIEARAAFESVGSITGVVNRHSFIETLVLETSSGASLKLSFPLPHIVRVQIVPSDIVWSSDFAIEEKPRKTAFGRLITGNKDEIIWQSMSGVKVVVRKADSLISIFDENGALIVADANPAMFDRTTGEISASKKRSALNETYYGFGEKAMPLSRDSQTITNWNTDTYRYTFGTDPLYQSIPFFIALSNGKSYGLFFNNTYRTTFDTGKTAPDKLTFAAADGMLDYFVFTGGAERKPAKILEDYTDLTGRMELPPMWSLGYQQSRFSYFPDSRVREIAAEFRKRKIPADVIYIDIDFMDGFRIFTWDKAKFPNPKKLHEDLANLNFKSIVIVNPAVKKDENFSVYNEGSKNKFFVRYLDGTEFNGSVWAGNSAFIDFTNPQARDWFGAKYKVFLDAGVSGFWNDMNEPSVFPAEAENSVGLMNSPFKTIPLDAGYVGGIHKEIHNVYGMQMARATFENLRKLAPEKRPFVLSRAGFSGIQRYAAVWTGDNTASWEHLQLSLPMLLNMSVSGVPFVGADVGGYSDNPSGELFARWLQAAALMPLLRPHAEKGTIDKEPWAFGAEFEKINRASIELRYQFLPYIYTLFREQKKSGAPVLRPLWFDYPQDAKTYLIEDEYLIGKDLLVAPVMRQGQIKRQVYFPAGDDWRDWTTGALFKGGTSAEISAPLDKLPVFARVGATIPTQSPIQSTTEMPNAVLTLNVISGIAPDKTEITNVYQDAGDGYEYQRNRFRETAITHGRGLLTFARKGDFTAAPEIKFVEVIGIETPPNGVKIDDADGEINFDAANKRARINIKTKDFRTIRLIR